MLMFVLDVLSTLVIQKLKEISLKLKKKVTKVDRLITVVKESSVTQKTGNEGDNFHTTHRKGSTILIY